jgi:glyoxylase-like metal-dependent hydrolase (beta-lactamase superfamily II)
VIEPSVRAFETTRIAPYTMHWSVADDRIGGDQSDSYSVRTPFGVVFFDPLPLTYAAADDFPSIGNVMLTTGRHQRASWRYRVEHGARIWAPRGCVGLRGEPDMYYTEGSNFPAGVRAVATPGPDLYTYSFLLTIEGVTLLFVGDLVRRRDSEAPLEFFPPETQFDHTLTRESVEKLLGLDFDVLCLSHGGYVDDDPKGVLRALLERTA